MRKILSFVLPLAVLAALIGAVFLFVIPNIHWGGAGDGNGTGEGISASESISPQASATDSIQISEIRIDKDKIYFDGELCNDETILKDKITVIGSEREFCFVYDNAIKGTYDKVEAVLSDLEGALGIIVKPAK